MAYLILNTDSFNTSLACRKLEYFKKEEYQGIVMSKYLDQKNHSAQTIKMQGKNDYGIILARDTSGFYDYVKAGDSLIKIKGQEYIKVYRQDSILRQFKIYFGCD
ncbi:hypothetical protein [Solitalea canadensis]|nr:hypothetical protein [Solitalea canadensis]